jgi:tRNA A-37 threonylcarbamoyl transferase component Bud32
MRNDRATNREIPRGRIGRSELHGAAPGGVPLGHELGSYRVVRLIGEGAVGRVYEVEHMKLGRRMAIKLLHADAGSDEAVVRFFNEARVVNEIRHPNIVDIEDFVSSPSGEHYLLMELLVGEDLGAAIAREGSFAPERVAAIGAQLASALAAVHRKSLVYRDVKPDNVYLHRDDGREVCKLLDFGVAKIVGQRTGAAAIGAPEYAAPEQILAADRVDGRCDIYALGMLMYACLTGRPAFVGLSADDTLLAQCSERVVPPSQRSQRPIPAALEAIVMTCLAKEPADRYGNADELRQALQSLQFEPVVAHAPAVPMAIEAPEMTEAIELAPRRARRGGVVMVVLLFAAAAAALVVTLAPPSGDDDDAHAKPATVAARPASAPTPRAPTTADPIATAKPTENAEPAVVDDPVPAVDEPKAPAMALSMTSKPTGAELFLGEERTPLGRAGTTASIPLSSEPVTVTAVFDDGTEVSQTIVPDRPTAMLAFVRQAAKKKSSTKPPRTRPRPDTQDKVGHDDTMDPFK